MKEETTTVNLWYFLMFKTRNKVCPSTLLSKDNYQAGSVDPYKFLHLRTQLDKQNLQTM